MENKMKNKELKRIHQIEFEIEFVEPNFGAKISLIMISEFQLWFSPLIQDQFQDSPLSVLRCHEA